MDFADNIRAFAKQIAEKRGFAETEQATKTALIMPFLKVLGYDPFDPQVVVPEYCADFGDKKSCKVDYAIKRGGNMVIIIEAKNVGDSLDGSKEAQLQKYFQSLLSVKIAILTDGIVYKFFTDLENPNVMDKKPFMTFDFADIDETLIPELKKLCNDCFDLDTALCAAQELKYLSQLKRLVADELNKPSDDFVRHFAKQVYDGKLMSGVVEEFRPRLKTAFEQHMNDVLNARLTIAMDLGTLRGATEATPSKEEPETDGAEKDSESRIVTTPGEWEGYHIVRAIMAEIIPPEDVIMKDAISYCSIFYKGNSHRPICRLRFNNPKRLVLETFDAAAKVSTLHQLEKVSDIYQHGAALRGVIAYYDNKA